MGNIFDFLLVNPMTNALMLLYGALGNSYVLAIIALTLIIRLAILPLAIRQQISAMKMAAMQPQIRALQEKYKNDPQKLSEEMRKLGFNPFSGCLPLLLQFPILIAMYQAIVRTLAVTPLNLVELGSHVYSFLPSIASLVPIESTFLGIFDLGLPDRYFIIPILVVVSTYLANKLLTPPSTDPAMQQTNQMLQLMMPLMFGFFMLSTPAGLGIYWIAANVVGVLQYYITKPILDRARTQHGLSVPAAPATASAASTAALTSASTPATPPPKPKVKVKATLRVNQSASVRKREEERRQRPPAR